MKKKGYPTLIIVIIGLVCFSCNGPRYIYSSSPFLSPVPLKKGSASIAAGHFTHNKNTLNFDSLPNSDKAFAVTGSYMPGKKIMLTATVDLKKERSVFATITDPTARLNNNGGFDSSDVKTKRYTAGLGIAYFFDPLDQKGIVTPGIAGSLNLHSMRLKESGQLNSNAYRRFFDMHQLSFSFQYNLLLKLSKRVNLAYIARLTLVKFFNPKTDFTQEEQLNTGLSQSGKIQLYPCLISGYVDYKPFKNLPFYVEAQLYNDVDFRDKVFAKFEQGRPNVKGSGIYIGVKYVFLK